MRRCNCLGKKGGSYAGIFLTEVSGIGRLVHIAVLVVELEPYGSAVPRIFYRKINGSGTFQSTMQILPVLADRIPVTYFDELQPLVTGIAEWTCVEKAAEQAILIPALNQIGRASCRERV